MKLPFITIAFVFALLFIVTTADTNDDNNCQNIDSNWYCRPVSAISYSNFGQPGTYSKVTSMADGKCEFSPFSYSGGMAPLDREVSWHFRGPLHLKQFAYYIPGAPGPAKRDIRGYENGHPRMSNHKADQHNHTVTKTIVSTVVVTVTVLNVASSTHWNGPESMIYETVNGKLTSYSNPYYLTPPTTDTSTATSTSTSTSISTSNSISTSASVEVSPVDTISAVSSPSARAAIVPSAPASEYNWVRQAYYQAESQISQNVVFLNNKGGQSSGVWDQIWGNSLSYASPDGLSCSPSPQILSDALIPDGSEISLFTSTACTGSSCGAVRPGSVAYHGFSGSSKLFLLEFSMPLTGKTGFNADMPSAWMLNAEIPRTQQYGDCSCFASGCGEWDIFEALDSGNTRCKSTFHGGSRSGGESDYFNRPVGQPIKVAVIFDGHNSTGHIVVLDSSFDIEEVIAEEQITDLISKVTQLGHANVFRLPD